MTVIVIDYTGQVARNVPKIKFKCGPRLDLRYSVHYMVLLPTCMCALEITSYIRILYDQHGHTTLISHITVHSLFIMHIDILNTS